MAIPKRIIDSGNIAVKECKHGLFTYLANDLFVGRSLDLYGEWTEPEIDHLTQLVLPNSIIVDAGAFIGTHTIALAKITGIGGFVYAFEPQRMIYNILCGNVAMNGLSNVKCYNAGLADVPGRATIPLLDPTFKQNFGSLGLNQYTEGDITPITTIDSLELQNCHLIKADVEGMEVKVLMGAQLTIKKFKPILYVENNRPDTSQNVIATVNNLGYTAYWDILNYYNPNNFFGNKINVFKKFAPEVNLLCIPEHENVIVKGFIKVNGEDDDWKKAIGRLAKKRKTTI
jgi:FkbM family methyltransferase